MKLTAGRVYPASFRNEWISLADSIRQRRRNGATLSAGRAALQIALATKEPAQSRRPVAISESANA